MFNNQIMMAKVDGQLPTGNTSSTFMYVAIDGDCELFVCTPCANAAESADNIQIVRRVHITRNGICEECNKTVKVN